LIVKSYVSSPGEPLLRNEPNEPPLFQRLDLHQVRRLGRGVDPQAAWSDESFERHAVKNVVVVVVVVVVLNSHRIHGAGIYANINGVY
jgi:hypothetical protein